MEQKKHTMVFEEGDEGNAAKKRLESLTESDEQLLPSTFFGDEIIQLESFGGHESVIEASDFAEELDQEEPGLNIERVLEKQKTHDLYCPVCNSCITRRIVLRKRKRKLQNARLGLEKETLKTDGSSELDVSSPLLANVEADEVGRATQAGNGLKLFQFPGDGTKKEATKVPQKISSPNDAGRDVLIVVGTSLLEPKAPQAEQNANILVESEAGETVWLDVLKSVVYGGLMEYITSLGIVFSAVGAGVATLNVLALGLANLVARVFILGHNLRDLKKEPSGKMYEQEDRYQKNLGRRDKFLLHTVVATCSFLFFGLLPLLTYGFSFYNSNEKDLKLAAVAGSSPLCILLLAAGKAHVQSPPKSFVATISYYLLLGIMASGASYVLGHLIRLLLQNLGLFVSAVSLRIYVS